MDALQRKLLDEVADYIEKDSEGISPFRKALMLAALRNDSDEDNNLVVQENTHIKRRPEIKALLRKHGYKARANGEITQSVYALLLANPRGLTTRDVIGRLGLDLSRGYGVLNKMRKNKLITFNNEDLNIIVK